MMITIGKSCLCWAELYNIYIQNTTGTTFVYNVFGVNHSSFSIQYDLKTIKYFNK